MITDGTISRYSGLVVKSTVPAQILDGSGFVTFSLGIEKKDSYSISQIKHFFFNGAENYECIEQNAVLNM